MPTDRKLKILIVDDKPRNTASLAQILRQEDVEILKAHSGNEALGLMLDHEPALVLLDVQMPEMDGYEVAAWMHRNPSTRKIPIIFVTAINKEPRHINAGYQAGAVDYLFKPIDPVVIRAKVGVFLAIQRHQREREVLVRELNRSNARLQELTRRKSDFLASASHELRTPLTVIREFCSLVHDEVPGPINDEQRNCLGSALRNCDRLAKLVDDLLNLDAIESGSNLIDRRRLDLAVLLTETQADFLTRCLPAGQDLLLQIPDDLPAVLADPAMVTQVLVNLVGNAHKFTPAGGRIVLEASAAEAGIRVTVSDTGPGIAAGDQEKVFEKFTQLHRKEAPGPQGTGLGLAISRRIMELHGSRMGLESTPGVGSDFWFELPAYSPAGHLEAFLHDAMISSAGYPGPWSLVLMRDACGDEEALDRLQSGLRGVMRQGEDRTARLEIADDQTVGILLKTGRDGALAFLARLEGAVEDMPGVDPAGLQFALREVNGRDGGPSGLLSEQISYTALSLDLEREGADDVQEENPGCG